MAAYSPKTGARCSCRPGVQRDNCPRCEGTGWVIDFKKIHERREREEKENPVAWAHGVMSYRHAPGSVAPMMNPRRKRLTRRKARLILHHGYVTRTRGKRRRRVKLTAKQRRFFGARASGYPRRKPRGYGAEWLPVAYGGRKRRNPYRRNPGGGMGWGMIALLGVGAFFLLPRLTGAAGGGGLLSSLGIGPATVPPGYTPIGNGLYRSPSGTIVARNPQTGQMVAAMPGTVPTSAEDLLTRAGIALIPSVASNLASWVSGLFTTQHTATTPVTESPALPEGGGAIGTSDVTRSLDALPPLAPLPNVFGAGSAVVSTATGAPESGIFTPELPTLPPISVSPDGILYDLGADAQLAPIDWSQYELPPLPTDYATVDPMPLPDVGLTVGGTDATVFQPSDPVWGGFFGLGRRSMPGFRVNEARFLRRPPSYR